MYNYAPFWETLNRSGLSQYQLIKHHGVSASTLDALRKNNSITMNTIDDLCRILHCSISDIVEVVPDSK